jgi:hypothetical protein
LRQLARDGVPIATCGVVATEVLQGLRRPRAAAQVEAYFRDLVWLIPHEPETSYATAALYRALRAKGVTVRSTIGCMLVRLADENGCDVLARDADIARILKSGLVAVQPAPLTSGSDS